MDERGRRAGMCGSLCGLPCVQKRRWKSSRSTQSEVFSGDESPPGQQVSSRVGYKLGDDGKKVRYLKKTGEIVP